MRELAILWLVSWGTIFIALASIGLHRMPDLYLRLHAASKGATLGVACLALALVVHFGDGSLAVRAIGLGLVLFVTAPISTHLIARAGSTGRATVEPEEPGVEVDEHDW